MSRTFASVDPPCMVPELAAHNWTGRRAGLKCSGGMIPLRIKLTSDPVSMKTRSSRSASCGICSVTAIRRRTCRGPLPFWASCDAGATFFFQWVGPERSPHGLRMQLALLGDPRLCHCSGLGFFPGKNLFLQWGVRETVICRARSRRSLTPLLSPLRGLRR